MPGANPLPGALGTAANPNQFVFEAGTHVWNWLHYLHGHRAAIFGIGNIAGHVPVERLQVRDVMGLRTSNWAPVLL